ncbi:MAG: tetratricopeptide repeat protein [Deltaproteobacteria bacterium]|nr:tetratricopeptide repeat protein [Deltaproteobacteria bacterium]
MQNDTVPLGRAPMIGRVAERDALAAVVAEAVRAAAPRFITLVGTAGVGRSRLVSEGIADLRERCPGLRVFRGAVREEAGLQGALARILRARFGLSENADAHTQANEVAAQVMDLFGDRRVDEILHFVGAWLGLRFGSTVLAEAFAEHSPAYAQVSRAVFRRLFEVDAQRSPVMLVIEDAHLASHEGAQLLMELLEGFSKGPLVVLVSTRPEFFTQCPGFSRALGERNLQVDLAPLSTGESQVLARALLSAIENPPQELIDTAVELGGGNPMLLEHIVRLYFLQEVIAMEPDGMATIDLDRLEHISLPMSVEDAVRTRLAALSPPERELLQGAALVGSVFWIGSLVVLGRTGREAPAVWGGAEDLAPHFRDLLHGLESKDYVLRMPDSAIPGDEEYIFKHNLERERLLELVPSEQATALHLVLAEWLEFQLTERNEEQLDLLARHYEQGHRPLRAARCYLQSADRARARYANQKAVDHYRKGLELLGEHDVGLRLDATHHLGDVLTLLGRSEEGLGQFRAMLALAWRLDLRGKGGAAHNRIGRVFRESGNLDEAMRHLGTGLALFESAGDERGIGSSYDDIGKVHWMKGAYEMAQRFLLDGLARREALNDERGVALSLNNLGLVYQETGQYRAALDALTRALELRRAVGDLPGMVITLNNLGTLQQDRGDDEAALGLFRQGLEVAREIGDRRRQAVLLLNIGESQYRTRRSDEAVKILSEVETLCLELGDRLLLAEARRGLGKAHYLSGNITLALNYLERALELFEQVKSQVHLGVARRSLAEVLSAHGPETDEGRRAEKLFRQALAAFSDLGAELEYARTARTLAEYLGAAAEAPGADRAALEVEATQLRTSSEEILGRARRAQETRDEPSMDLSWTDPGIRRPELDLKMPVEPSVIVGPDALDDTEDLTPPDGVKRPPGGV